MVVLPKSLPRIRGVASVKASRSFGSKNVSVEHQVGDGAPGGTRTPDLLVRSQTLYPTELRARSE